MEPEHERTERRKIKVTDRRKVGGGEVLRGEEVPAQGDAAEFSPADVGAGDSAEGAGAGVAEVETPGAVSLEDHLRLQADFDNRRKRLMREADAAFDRGKVAMFKALLPALDNFERALDHEDGTSGLKLLYKELLASLSDEGLEEIPAEGHPFDPNVHEAVESHPDSMVVETVVKTVYRKGYRFKNQVLRPAMVVVSHPAPGDGSGQQTEG